MFAIEIDSYVAMITDELLGNPRKLPERLGAFQEQEGLIFFFDMSLTVYKDQKTYRRRSNYCFVIAGKSVWFSLVKGLVPSLDELNNITTWENTSNHDSCWRSDGLRPISRVYFEFAEQINKEMVADGLPEVAPVNMKMHVSLWKPWKLCNVVSRLDPADKNRYKREIVSIMSR